METTFIALLRGINVGGANRLNMENLREAAVSLGWRDPRTYIASGNLIFATQGEAETLASQLSEALRERMGAPFPVFVIDAKALARVVESAPLAPEDDRHLHLFFLDQPPTPDLDLIERFRAPSELVKIDNRVAYFHAPNGFGRSKLAAHMEKALGAPATARNLRTCRKLVEMSR